MGRVEGKVAFVTGAARGQGRSHAVHLAEEGADIIAVDICQDIASNEYPLARPEDLDETARLVEKYNRRIVPIQADVRDRKELAAALADGIAQLGGLDIVVANAGICPLGEHTTPEAFVDAVDVDLIGVLNTVHVALPHLSERRVHHHHRFGGRLAVEPILGIRPAGSRRCRLQHGQAGARRIHHDAGGRTRPPHDPRQRDTSDQLQHRHAAE